MLAAVLGGSILLSACGSSSDPKSWEEAESDVSSDGEVFPVKANFLRTCEEANNGEGGFDLAQARAYCTCAFDSLRENLEFADFAALDSGLRTNPDPNALEGEALGAWRVAEPLLDGCDRQAGT